MPLSRPVPAAPGEALFAGPVGRPEDYELLAQLHWGGEGVVWRARRTGEASSSTYFALKQLVPPSGRTAGEWPDDRSVERWRAQVSYLRGIDHPHLVACRDLFAGWPPHPRGDYIGDPPKELLTWYVVMGWVEGQTLHELVRSGMATFEDRARCLVEVARAVEHLHSGASTSGVILLHRDVKPGNVVVTPEGSAVLVDFGLLRAEGPEMTEPPAWTVPYVAPEVLEDPTRTSRASDVWALAATAFFAFTGQTPSASRPGWVRQCLIEHISGRVARPEAVAEAVLSVLDEQEPANRPSAGDWAQHLESATAGQGIGPGRPMPASASGTGGTLLPVGSPEPPPAAGQYSRRPRPPARRWAAVAAAAVVVAGGTAAGAVFSGQAPPSTALWVPIWESTQNAPAGCSGPLSPGYSLSQEMDQVSIGCGWNAAGAVLYVWLHSGAGLKYTFKVPAGRSERLIYRIPTGGFLNNASAVVSVDGTPSGTVSPRRTAFRTTALSGLDLWTSHRLRPGWHTWTIISKGNAVNFYGLWVETIG